jgi:hypothetical protein
VKKRIPKKHLKIQPSKLKKNQLLNRRNQLPKKKSLKLVKNLKRKQARRPSLPPRHQPKRPRKRLLQLKKKVNRQNRNQKKPKQLKRPPQLKKAKFNQQPKLTSRT